MSNAPEFTVRIEWSLDDQAYAAGLIRGGQPRILGGALAGMGATPGTAVQNLADNTQHLVIHGENYLTENPLSLADREWLYTLFGTGPGNHEMWQALRAAGSQVF